MNNLMAPSAASASQAKAPSANDSQSMTLDGSEISKGYGQSAGGQDNSVTQPVPSGIDYSFLNGSADGATSFASGGTVAPAAGQASQASQAYQPIPLAEQDTSSTQTSGDSRMAASDITDGYNLGPYRDWAIQVGKQVGAFKASGGPIESNHKMADHLASQGRGRDTTLVHMSIPEVKGLGSLHPSGQMPINPKTGLPEADFLSDVLPGIAGTVIGSVVGMPWLGAAIGGLGTWAATGNLGKGILSGLMSFGLGSIGGELANAGAQAAGNASTTAAKAAAASGSLADPFAQGAAQAGGASTQAASDIVTKAGQGVAGANPTGFFDKVAQGFQNAPETFGNMGRGLMNPQNLNLSKMMMPGIMGATGAYGLYSANQQPPAAPQPMMPQQGQAPTLANAPPRVPTGYKPPPGYGTSAAPQEGTFFQPNPVWNGYPMYASTGGEMRTYQTPDGGRYELAKGGVANLPSGMIRGPGAGMDDKIKGTIDGRRDVYLSDGEYVVDAQTISALGDGSSEAGAKRMKQLVENIRQKKFGSKKQPPKMAQTGGLASLGIV